MRWLHYQEWRRVETKNSKLIFAPELGRILDVKSLKVFFEKPFFILFIISITFAAAFWFGPRLQSAGDSEAHTYEVLQSFSESTFPPKIGVIREMHDGGHIGYYAIMGRVFRWCHGSLNQVRAFHLLIMFLSFGVFISLGRFYTNRNRLNPLWISFGLLLLAINPYSWNAAFQISFDGMLLLFSLLGLRSFVAEEFGWAAIFTAAAALIDWTGLLLPTAFVATRLSEQTGRVLRPLRLFYFLFPFLIFILPIMAWHGFVPPGEATTWLQTYREKVSPFRMDSLIYALAIFPVYSLWFSWSWGVKCRRRALVISAIAAAVAAPLFFVFPIHSDFWSQIQTGVEKPFGIIDQGALLLAGEYKNLLLFVPYVAGVFLLVQLILMDVLERTRCLRYFIFLFFVIQPISLVVGDRILFLLLPFLILLSLSEGLVGEEGNLSGLS